jgi:hypothetical protein
VVNDGRGEDDSVTQDFVWGKHGKLFGQRENFMGSVGPQWAAKHVTEIMNVFELFFNRELNRHDCQRNGYMEQFLSRRELSVR